MSSSSPTFKVSCVTKKHSYSSYSYPVLSDRKPPPGQEIRIMDYDDVNLIQIVIATSSVSSIETMGIAILVSIVQKDTKGKLLKGVAPRAEAYVVHV